MFSNISEVSTLMAVLAVVAGALYALRRQANVFEILDKRDLTQRVQELEIANSFLVTELGSVRQAHFEELRVIRKKNDDLAAVLETMQDEARLLKMENSERFEEIAALRKVLHDK